jgi:hypothetical protein
MWGESELVEGARCDRFLYRVTLTGLKPLVYAALATSVCGLKLLVYAASSY